MLASRVGGIPEILGEASPALMEPDQASVSTTMQAALLDETRFAAGMPQPALLHDRFSAKAMAASINAVYAGILAARR